MGSRVELQEKLEDVIGVGNVYFQPPANVELKYPCIIYKLDNYRVQHADNDPYLIMNRYQVSVIDRSPDSDIPMKIATMRTARHVRTYVVSNLYHSIFELYF